MKHKINTKSLTSASLFEYYNDFKKEGIDINILEEFCFQLSTLLDLERNINLNERVENILNNMNTASIEKAKDIIQLYIDFCNSIVSMIQKMESMGVKQRISYIDRIFDGFIDIYSHDIKHIHTILDSGGMNLLNIVFYKYNIDISQTKFKNEDELLKILIEAFGKNATYTILQLLISLEKYEKLNSNPDAVREIFHSMIIFTIFMNLKRKKEMLEEEIEQEEMELEEMELEEMELEELELEELAQKVEFNIPQNVGRNNPCPCGSGKKYKKCCLLKIN